MCRTLEVCPCLLALAVQNSFPKRWRGLLP